MESVGHHIGLVSAFVYHKIFAQEILAARLCKAVIKVYDAPTLAKILFKQSVQEFS